MGKGKENYSKKKMSWERGKNKSKDTKVAARKHFQNQGKSGGRKDKAQKQG